MIETNTTADYTELYVGGGNYIAQSAPTNFHTFYKQKILTAEEHIEDFREVTAAEREALEQSDAAWSRPPQSLIDQWNGACAYEGTPKYFGCYNEETGYFELNGLTDIGYDEAMEIYSLYPVSNTNGPSDSMFSGNKDIRTLFPIRMGGPGTVENHNCTFYGCVNLEVLRIIGGGCFAGGFRMFLYCGKLRRIEGSFGSSFGETDEMFNGCGSLEYFRMWGVQRNLNLRSCSRIGMDSLEFLVQYSSNGTKGITIYLHANAYGRLTDELIALAADRNITFAT